MFLLQQNNIYKIHLSILYVESRVAQWIACWAHNPEVRGSKPRSAEFFFFLFFNDNGVRVHVLPCSIGAFQTVLSFLLFRDTVSGFSHGATETQNVTTTLTFGLKRGTSLSDVLFARKRFFLDVIHVSLHDGMIRLSLFVETDALHLSLSQVQFLSLES